jgi:hypothetical protein
MVANLASQLQRFLEQAQRVVHAMRRSPPSQAQRWPPGGSPS